MKRSKVSSLAISASLLTTAATYGSVAGAQGTPPPSDELIEVVVTGSLIQRPNNTAVSPIVSISDSAIRESGVANVVDALNQFPSFTVGGNSATGGQGTGGRATINLHGLGTNRNLVLLDGRRLPVSDISGNVDINIIPESIIGGVDAITGGASAVYGSDAMSGVVNFRTVRALDGVRADVHVLDERAGRCPQAQCLAGASAPASPRSRGNLIAAFSYTDQDPLNGSQPRLLLRQDALVVHRHRHFRALALPMRPARPR